MKMISKAIKKAILGNILIAAYIFIVGLIGAITNHLHLLDTIYLCLSFVGMSVCWLVLSFIRE